MVFGPRVSRVLVFGLGFFRFLVSGFFRRGSRGLFLVPVSMVFGLGFIFWRGSQGFGLWFPGFLDFWSRGFFLARVPGFWSLVSGFFRRGSRGLVFGPGVSVIFGLWSRFFFGAVPWVLVFGAGVFRFLVFGFGFFWRGS